MATVQPLAADLDLPVRTDDRLREHDLTDWWLDDHRQVLRRVWNDFSLTLPGGESSAECQRRVGKALKKIRVCYEHDERMLVSSHGNAIGLYLNRLDSSFGFEVWTEMRNLDLFAVQEDQWNRLPLTIR